MLQYVCIEMFSLMKQVLSERRPEVRYLEIVDEQKLHEGLNSIGQAAIVNTSD